MRTSRRPPWRVIAHRSAAGAATPEILASLRTGRRGAACLSSTTGNTSPGRSAVMDRKVRLLIIVSQSECGCRAIGMSKRMLEV